MRKLLPFFLLFFPFTPLFAKGGLLSLEIEPIVGYEHIQKLVPYRHTKERIVYGARVLAGIPLISAEAELTRGTDTELFPDRGLATKDTTDKAKLGLRATFRLIGVVYGFGRAGGQASKNRHEETRAGVTTVTEEPIYLKPYVGAGLRARLTHHFRFDADFTVIFHDTHNWKYYEYQTSAGFAIVFP